MYLLEKGAGLSGTVHIKEVEGLFIILRAGDQSIIYLESGLPASALQTCVKNVEAGSMSLQEADAYIMASISLEHAVSPIAWARHATVWADPDPRALVAEWLRRHVDASTVWDLLDYVDAERFVEDRIAPDDRAVYVSGRTGEYLVIFDE